MVRTRIASCIVLACFGGLALAQAPDAKKPEAKKVEETKPAPILPPPLVLPGSTSSMSGMVPGPLDLDGCIQMGLANQPAVIAARASLASAQAGKQGLDHLGFMRMMSKDIPVRQQQACLGVEIARFGVCHAEWEARNAIARTYWSAQFARMQHRVAIDVLKKMEQSLTRFGKLAGAGDPNVKITPNEVAVLELQVQFFKLRMVEATTGVQKALAALREAIGVRPECTLVIAEEDLPPLVPYVCKEELVSAALANRWEIHQARLASDLSRLEVCAQSKLCFRPSVKTFAAGADIHAKPIPQGENDGTYKPGAIGPEMPTFLNGCRSDRMQRACELTNRSHAVANKAEQLVALDVEVNYLKWKEAADKLELLKGMPDRADEVFKKNEKRLDIGQVGGEEYIRSQLFSEMLRGQVNEALFNQATALANLERATGGVFRAPNRQPGVVIGPPLPAQTPPAPPNPQPQRPVNTLPELK